MDADDRQSRDLRRQQIIDDLARSGEGRPVADLINELTHRLGEKHLLPMPAWWIKAVASSAALGNPYVISTMTENRLSAPVPDTPQSTYGVS